MIKRSGRRERKRKTGLFHLFDGFDEIIIARRMKKLEGLSGTFTKSFKLLKHGCDVVEEA